MGDKATGRVDLHDEDAGVRLDVVLSRRIAGLSRAVAKRWIRDGRVTVNGRRVKKAHLVERGDEVCVSGSVVAGDQDAVADASVDFSVRLEAQDYVVVEKPAGVPTHPLRPGERGALANGLVARYPQMRGVGYGPREPGIVHRLDTGTSGLLLAARNQAAFDALASQLRNGEIEKRYVAACEGAPSGLAAMTMPIARDPKNHRKVVACSSDMIARRLAAQEARTEVIRSVSCGNRSFVEVSAFRARRHQVRVHLAAVGHPLLGDTLYGGPALEGLAHHLLHASFLAFTCPREQRVVSVDSPTPSSWRRWIDCTFG